MVILGDMLSVYPFVQKRTTYESIRNSGNLDIISDYELKENLIAYYESFDEVQTKEDVYFDWLNKFVIPFVYENMDLVTQTIQSRDAIKSTKFQNLVIGYQILLRQNVDTYEIISALNDNFIMLLSEKVEPH